MGVAECSQERFVYECVCVCPLVEVCAICGGQAGDGDHGFHVCHGFHVYVMASSLFVLILCCSIYLYMWITGSVKHYISSIFYIRKYSHVRTARTSGQCWRVYSINGTDMYRDSQHVEVVRHFDELTSLIW